MAPNTVYVTALREPVSLFESSFSYFNFGGPFGLSGPAGLNDFINDIYLFYSTNPSVRLLNPMLFDLGMDTDKMWSMTNIDNRIRYLDEKFDLVMITDYMDESLVLLRNLMCWNTDDIVAFSMNTRASYSKTDIFPAAADKIKKWHAGDVKLYDYFNRSLWQRIELFGNKRMQTEVEELKSRREYYFQSCIDGVVTNDPDVWHPGHVNVESVQIKSSAENDTICVGLTKTELPFTIYVREKLLQRIRDINFDPFNVAIHNKIN
ncbi:galactosylceramide sulfotransferase-like [Glandiceps talaboti]